MSKEAINELLRLIDELTVEECAWLMKRIIKISKRKTKVRNNEIDSLKKKLELSYNAQVDLQSELDKFKARENLAILKDAEQRLKKTCNGLNECIIYHVEPDVVWP